MVDPISKLYQNCVPSSNIVLAHHGLTQIFVTQGAHAVMDVMEKKVSPRP